MWCYQKPGFEALVLAELQRQQQCSQFCDTLLKTEGISVPAHSCILSAISPHISSALSSAPPPPAGQSHLLEFNALGTCTLLHMVRLLYCGEMAGEGEKEKQDAISAAAKLGIHGLVEVAKGDLKDRKEDGQHAEVGVQTEPLMPEVHEGRRGRWRREVREGSTFLWKETPSEGEIDMWTQTEELKVNTAPTSQPAALETIDMSALQSLGTTNSQLVPPNIPYIPISLVYPPDENQMHQPSSALVDSIQVSTAAGHTSVAAVAPPPNFISPPIPLPSQVAPWAADPQSWWAGPQEAASTVRAAEEWEDEQLEQFQDNIPGYISYFLNPPEEEGPPRGRAGRRQGAGAGGARRAGTGERRAWRPRTGGRGRGRLTQMVDVQEVGVSRLQKMFLHRWGLRASKTGQGGGAAGRKLYLKTRELLKTNKKRRGRSSVWESSQSGDMPPYSGTGGGNTQRKRSTTQLLKQEGPPVGRAQRARAKPTTSQPFPSPALLPPKASYVPPASSLLHITSLPPPVPACHEEHFEHLLEEMMMGLDILPNNNGAPHSQPLPNSSSSHAYASCGSTLAQNKQQGHSTANYEMPVLQHQGEGALSEILDDFLQSFEQHIDSCAAREEVEMGSWSCTESSQPHTVLSKDRKTKTPHNHHLQNKHTPGPVRHTQITEPQKSDAAGRQPGHSQPRKTSAPSAALSKHTEGSPGKVKAPARRRRRRKNEYAFGINVKVRKSEPRSTAKAKTVDDQVDKQLQQMPVVKLERSVSLPAKVALQDGSCLEVKIPAKLKTTSEKDQPVSWSTKIYPIRSRFREARIMDSMPFLEPLVDKQPSSAGPPSHTGRPKKNGQLLSLSNDVSSAPPIRPQPVEPCGMDQQPERNKERHEEELTVQPQEEAERPRGVKRRAESEEETSDNSTVTKRVCFEQMAQPTPETHILSSFSADIGCEIATRELGDVSNARDGLRREKGEAEPVWTKIKLTEQSLMDEEMESSGVTVKHFASPSLHSEKEVRLGSTGSWEEEDDEDIDVIGGSSPALDPVIINWTQSSEGEEDEDIDVVGEETDYESSSVFITVD
ncbi:hypothetical protein ABVT39_006831 [Epinephelus coioides]